MTPLDRDAVRRAFSRAAERYEGAAVLQRVVEDRLLESVEHAKRVPARILDLGAGPGRASATLRKRFPKAQVVACDAAFGMLAAARRRAGWLRPFQRVCAEAERLPFAEASFDLVFSSLCLQWCGDLPLVFDELRRVLAPGGLLLASTFGPATLAELREAWSAADGAPHVNRFVDIARFGDALLAAGFRDPVLDREALTLLYRDPRTLMRELKAIGASNADVARDRGLGGKARLARVLAAYEALRRDGEIPATYEVIYAQAFGPEPGQPRRGRGGELATFPVASLRGSRRR
jgi:malonyl-CoA O-methyltransferase